MRVLTEQNAVRGPMVVTIGNFDGVHLGHQALIRQALKTAQERSQKMLVLTFEPHPVSVLRGPLEHFLITPGALKWHFLSELGAQWVRIIPFTPEFAQMPAQTFLDVVLGEQLQASAVVVGYNFSFGQGGLGNVSLLEKWGQRRQVSVEILPPFHTSKGQAVSSSAIRTYLRDGDLVQAQAQLGHGFMVENTIVRGDQRGRQLNTPTLNLVWPQEQVAPPFGVYAGVAQIAGGAPVRAVCNFGVRPTFGGLTPRLEAHILGTVEGEPYGQVMRLELRFFLRKERKFATPTQLVAQIQQDIEMAQRLLADSEHTP